MTGMQVGLALTQTTALTPLTVQVLRLLTLNQVEVDAVVAGQVATNAVLQAGPPRRCRWCAGWVRGGCCSQCASSRGSGLEPTQRLDEREVLRGEARLLVPAPLLPAVDAVVASLDELGLLPEALPAVAARLGLSPAAVAQALAAVKTAGPPGVGERTLTAALLAQARWHADRGAPPVLVAIVESHLPELARGDRAGIAAALGVAAPDVDAAVDYLRRRLRPAPLAAAGDRDLTGAPPDGVVLAHADGRLTVHVPTADDLGLGLDLDLTALPLPATERSWLAAQVDEARALIDAVDRRAAALARVASAAVSAQRDFVLRGPEAHRPLTRAGLAQVLGLHPSTVSRATKGTVLALPDGRREPLRAFFGGNVRARERLARMLASADPPATDAEAAARLAAEGQPVARRTVAKYRQGLARH